MTLIRRSIRLKEKNFVFCPYEMKPKESINSIHDYQKKHLPLPRKILAISCSTAKTSVAYLDRTQVILAEDSQMLASDTLLALINQVLPKNKLDGIQGLAIDTGPGSFIGIRTGISAVQAIAMAKQLPIFALSSLKLLALAARRSHPDKLSIVTALDARREEWYFAEWKAAEGDINSDQITEHAVVAEITPQLISPKQHVFRGSHLVAGNVWSDHLYGARVPNIFMCNSELKDQHLDTPNAGVLARVASNSERWLGLNELKPYYIRNSIATPAKIAAPQTNPL